ncbi:unnamed protein product, partial [Meganyctiphanes norvegica]
MAAEADVGHLKLSKSDLAHSNTDKTMAESKNQGRANHFVTHFKKHLLTIFTVLGIIGGVSLGLILRYSRPVKWTQREIMYVGYIGELFLRALNTLIIPLIVSSLVSAIGNMDLSLSKKIGFRAIAFYFITTVMAVVLGIVLVLLIKPGQSTGEVSSNTVVEHKKVYVPDLLMDIPRNLFAPNIIQACFETYETVIEEPKLNSHKSAYHSPLNKWDISHHYTPNVNIMGLVTFSIILGISLAKIGSEGKPLLNVFIALQSASMTITTWLISLSPIGILSLIAAMILEMDDFGTMLGQLGKYFGTVLLGIYIHGLLVLPLIYSLITKKLPFRFIANMGQAILTGFATATSCGTLPVILQCLEEKNHIDPRVSRFVIPIGTTVNMHGTALYEAVAAIFISQVRGMELSIGQIIAVSISATAAAVGAAGIPQAGLVTMVMVLNAVGLPAEDITLIIAVDWFLDRFRTAVNILGDAFGAAVVYEMSKKELEELDFVENVNYQQFENEYNPNVDSKLTKM